MLAVIWFAWGSSLSMLFHFSSFTISEEVLRRMTSVCPTGSILASTHPAKGLAILRFFLGSKWLPSSTNLPIKVSQSYPNWISTFILQRIPNGSGQYSFSDVDSIYFKPTKHLIRMLSHIIWCREKCYLFMDEFEWFDRAEGLLPSKTAGSIKDESTLPNSVFDYDAYDAKVFAVPFSRSNKVSPNNKSFEEKRWQLPVASRCRR